MSNLPNEDAQGMQAEGVEKDAGEHNLNVERNTSAALGCKPGGAA